MGGLICDDYIEPADPRRSDCLRCARPAQAHPQCGATTRRRNVEFERQITQEAARSLVDPSPLIEFAETRAAGSLSSEYVPDAGLVTLTRDRIRETKEELADARNHLIWWLEENPAHPLRQRRFLALRHLTLLYDLLLEGE